LLKEPVLQQEENVPCKPKTSVEIGPPWATFRKNSTEQKEETEYSFSASTSVEGIP